MRARPVRIDAQIAPRYARVVRVTALKAAARAALDAARVRRRVSLTLVVAGDAVLRKLNRDFLGIDGPTDVLSFASELGGGRRPRRKIGARSETFAHHEEHENLAQHEGYLGDVIISLARARAQAHSGGHPLIDELRLLVIHGVLHLLGYDHETPAHKARMWAAQAQALRKVGASIEGPAE